MKLVRFIFWTLSILMLGVAVGLLLDKEFFSAICACIVTLTLNPLILEMLVNKFGGSRDDCDYYFKIILVPLGLFIAWIISVVILKIAGINIDVNGEESFISIFKICVYIIYIVILFIHTDTNKEMKYKLFGIIYLICVMVSFSSVSISEWVVETIDKLPFINVTDEELNIIFNLFLNPIKEAILTYIIFDTVTNSGEQNKKVQQKKKGKKNFEKKLNKNSFRNLVKKIWNIEKKCIKLTLFKSFVVTYFVFYVAFHLQWSFNYNRLWFVFLGTFLVCICIDYYKNKDIDKNTWDVVVENCRIKDEVKKFNAIRSAIILLKNSLNEEEKNAMKMNISFIEAKIANTKADIVITPIAFSVYAWFIGGSISFEALQLQLYNFSLDAFVKLCLIILSLMVVKALIKQYSETVFIEKALESIKEEFHLCGKKSEED